jgi:ABC-type multidrug transport system fused ATPase/permease subunit
MFAPAATFSLYALQSYITGANSFDTNKAFTSLALINLVAYPASRLLSAVPNTAASLGCFDRIQEFLLTNETSTDQPDTLLQNGRTEYSYRDAVPRNESFIVDVRHADLCVLEDRPPILCDINISLNFGTMVGITGPVGSGKTSLIKLILGEALCAKGEVLVQSRTIGYCAQTPWITHGTIREVITGYETDYDALWYEMVLEACSLKVDMALLSEGENTIIGSRGIKLSGGQRHRIALARALYARPQLFILDDTFSSLDPKTQSTIWGRLFGDGGLIKRLGATVLVATHSSEPIVHRWRKLQLTLQDNYYRLSTACYISRMAESVNIPERVSHRPRI